MNQSVEVDGLTIVEEYDKEGNGHDNCHSKSQKNKPYQGLKIIIYYRRQKASLLSQLDNHSPTLVLADGELMVIDGRNDIRFSQFCELIMAIINNGYSNNIYCHLFDIANEGYK